MTGDTLILTVDIVYSVAFRRMILLEVVDCNIIILHVNECIYLLDISVIFGE